MVDDTPRKDIERGIDRALTEMRTQDPDMRRDMVVTEWIVVAAARGFDEAGEPVTQVLRFPDGVTPPHHLVGLLIDASDLYRRESRDG